MREDLVGAGHETIEKSRRQPNVGFLASLHILGNRHGLDLFPDDKRTVPFGCGATVVYNYADFRFENPFPQSVLMRARVENGEFLSELWTTGDPGVRVEVEEVDHRFFQDDDGWMRENRLRRRVRDESGHLLSDVEIAHNKGRVLYEPPTEKT